MSGNPPRPRSRSLALISLGPVLAFGVSGAEEVVPPVRDAEPALVHPFRCSIHLTKLRPRDQDPWQREVPGRIYELPDTAAATTDLMEGSVLVFCGEDRKTLRFFDLRRERFAAEVRNNTLVTRLFGAGRALVSYSAEANSLSCRSLPDLKPATDWSPPPGNLVDAIGVGDDAQEILVLDRSHRLIHVDFRNPDQRIDAMDLDELQPANRRLTFIRPALRPCTRLAVSGNLETVHFGGWMLARGPRPRATKLPFHAPEQPPLALGRESRWVCGHWLMDDSGTVLASANTLHGQVIGHPCGGWFCAAAFGSSAGLQVIHSKNLTAAFSVSNLTELVAGFAREKLPADQRLFLCPSLGKIAILNRAADRLYVRDLDFKLLAAAMPGQTSPPVILLEGNRPPAYTFRFSRPEVIEKIRLLGGSGEVHVDPANGWVDWRSAPKPGTLGVELTLPGGGIASGIVELVVPPRENGS